jgi:HptB-dependent secretion and biofilm anti anti-sigma factor
MAIALSSSNTGSAVIAFSGALDFACEAEVIRMFEREWPFNSSASIDIDLAEVGSLDSSGLGVLLIIRDRVCQAGNKIALRNCSQRTFDVLKRASFDKIFQLAN